MSTDKTGTGSAHVLPDLPYAENALVPAISTNTVAFHYRRHHRGYLDSLNRLLTGTELATLPLERIVAETAGVAEKSAIFNNAAQIWNHTFYWNSLRPDGGGEPPVMLQKAIEASFGSVADCRKELSTSAMSLFGSGWIWLVSNDDKLEVITTSNAEVPMTLDKIPLLAIDVWEHAYYLDFQNRRMDYVAAVLDKLINWEFAAKNLG
jgi:superoxide dismutase, Fe-Mn family